MIWILRWYLWLWLMMAVSKQALWSTSGTPSMKDSTACSSTTATTICTGRTQLDLVFHIAPGQDQSDFQWSLTSTLRRRTVTATSLPGNPQVTVFSRHVFWQGDFVVLYIYPFHVFWQGDCCWFLFTPVMFSCREMPLPALYQMLSILFFLSGCFWVFILKKNGTEQVCVQFIGWLPQTLLPLHPQVFRIHWIMAALVFLKSLSLFFHGVGIKTSNIQYINSTSSSLIQTPPYNWYDIDNCSSMNGTFGRWTTLKLLQMVYTRSPGPSCTTSHIFSRSWLFFA